MLVDNRVLYAPMRRRAFQFPLHFCASLRHAMLWLFLGLFYVLPVTAFEVEGLYQATLPVDSRNDARERTAAFAAGMRQVLVKVSGQEDVLEHPAVRRALNSPDDYVDSWSYNSRRLPDGGGSIIELRITFFESEIHRLLSDNNLAVWPSNRPLTLVWLVVESEYGERNVLGQDNSSELAVSLRDRAVLRGMPLLFPLMDLDDRRSVDTAQLWNLDEEHIANVSQRYAVESVLVVRVFSSLGNEYLGRAKYLFRNQTRDMELYGNSLAALVEPAVNQVANELSAYYSVQLNSTDARIKVFMQVDGVEDLEDYARLLRYVEGLTDVHGYTVSHVQDSTIQLELSTGGQVRQLMESIALGRNMQAVTDITREGEQLFVHYRWLD